MFFVAVTTDLFGSKIISQDQDNVGSICSQSQASQAPNRKQASEFQHGIASHGFKVGYYGLAASIRNKVP
jgi:hypothetical protein